MGEPRHLKRLTFVWQRQPIYFLTTCVAGRRPLLANRTALEILRDEWSELRGRYGWAMGRYVVMPDHVHFFAAPTSEAKPLPLAVGKWKEWSAKRILKSTFVATPFWQPEFFDHVLRSEKSRSEKWTYVRENPVRAGLVKQADDWPYMGAMDFE